MKVFIIISLAGMVGLAWLWLKRPSLKGTSRTWPTSRGKTGAKPKVPARL
jgi:hypothetical protein